MAQLNESKFRTTFPNSSFMLYIIFAFYLISKATAYVENLNEDGTTMTEMMNYMKKFGYLTAPSSSSMMGQLISGDEIKNSIKLVQKIAKLPETGILDDATAKYIKKPRCGNTDTAIISHAKELNRKQSSVTRRGKRYAINQYRHKWKKQSISWRLDRLTRKVPESVVMQEMQKAFSMWSVASNLRFYYTDSRDPNQEADIVVSFETGNHDDGNHFDGPGGVLAHAFTPSGSKIAGDLHFDDAENWKSHYESMMNPDTTTSLLWTATHELGHSLGLDHSDDEKAIMYPQYMGGSEALDTLPYDDTNGIRMLYYDIERQPQETHTTTKRYTTTTRRYDTTTTTRRYDTTTTTRRYDTTTTTRRYDTTTTTRRYDTTTTTRRYDRFTRPTTRFRHYPSPTYSTVPRIGTPSTRKSTSRPPKYTETTIADSTPADTLQKHDICRVIFDAIAAIRGELYIFKGNLLWKISADGTTYGPNLINTFWIGLPDDLDKIDAAYEKQIGDLGITLFSGDRFWVFNGNSMKDGYPRRLSHLGIKPDVTHLDGALAWGHEGKTYFFSNDQYWRFNEKLQRVDEGYPKTMGNWKGVEYPISSAFRWKDGKTYFFKDRLFWSLNDTRMELDHPIGRISSSFWFNCPEQHKNHKERDNSVDQQLKWRKIPRKQNMDEDSAENSSQKISLSLSIIILFILINYLNLIRT